MSLTKGIVFFDTEGSGRGENSIMQFGAVEVDKNFGVKRVISEYFKITEALDMSAFMVHKLSNTICEKLTKYQFFEGFKEETDFFDKRDVVWVAHKATFDVKTINGNLTRQGFDPVDFGPRVYSFEESNKVDGPCWMDSIMYFKNVLELKTKGGMRDGSFSLGSLADSYIPSSQIPRLTEILDAMCISCDATSYSLTFHNAVFDSYILMLLFLRFKDLLK